VTQLSLNTFNNSAYLGIDPDLPAQIEAAANAGFDLLGPDMFSLEAWTGGGGRLDELVQLMEKRGMRCGVLAGAVYLTEREQSTAAARRAAQMADVLKPTWVQINVGTAPDKAAGELLDEVCDIVAPTGARIAIEYLPYIPVNCIAATKTLIDHVGTDRAGMVVDSWHHFRGPDTYAELESLPLEAIAYVEFDDALPVIGQDLAYETVHRRAMPGEGEFDLAGFCQRLQAKGYEGLVSVEVLSDEWRARSLGDFTRRAYETTRRFWP